MIKLKCSIPTYNEIASLLEAQGLQLGVNVNELTIEKGTALVRPVDYRMATIRKDAATIAAQVFEFAKDEDIVELSDRITNYILNGKEQTKDWK